MSYRTFPLNYEYNSKEGNYRIIFPNTTRASHEYGIVVSVVAPEAIELHSHLK
jgi:hypothetical protein